MNYVKLKTGTVGADSDSGAAVTVKINDVWHWIPYSQIRSIHRNPRVQDSDEIEVAEWLATKEEWE